LIRRPPTRSEQLEGALASLTDDYAQRLRAPARTRAQGGVPLPYLGADVPRELIEAAGFVPVLLHADPGRARNDDERLLGAGVDPMVRALVPVVLALTRELCPGVVIAHDGEGALRMFHALRMRARQEGAAGRSPEMHFFDLLHLPRPSTARYNGGRVAELAAALSRWSGRDLGQAALVAACEEENRKRALLRQLQALRQSDASPLTGSEALAVFGACALRPAAQATARLQRLLSELSARAPRSGRRLFVTGSDWDHPALYRALEAQGALVVGEDLELGQLAVRDPVQLSADPLASLAAYYQDAPPTGRRYTGRSRAELTTRAALAARAQCVLCVLREGDPGPAWDVPEQRRLARDAGLPFAVVSAQPYAGPSPASLRSALEAAA